MKRKLYFTLLVLLIFLLQVALLSAWGRSGSLLPLLLWLLLYLFYYHNYHYIYFPIIVGSFLDLYYGLPAVNILSFLLIYIFYYQFFSRWFVFKNFLSWSILGLLGVSIYFWFSYGYLFVLSYWLDITLYQFNAGQFFYYLLLNFITAMVIYFLRLLKNKKKVL